MSNKNQRGFTHIILLFIIFTLVAGSIVLVGNRVRNVNQVVPAIKASIEQPKTITFAAAGDFGSDANAAAVLDKIGESKTDFTLALGDLDYANTGGETAWCDFVKSHVGAKYPFEVVAGNHDDGTATQASIVEYRKCLPDVLGLAKGDYGLEYYFDYAGLARVILVSPDIDSLGFSYKKGEPHYAWLEQAINSAKTAGVKWVIVGMHKNCLSVGVKTCEIGEDIINLAISKKVDLILQGHEHAYIRSKHLGLSASCPAILANVVNKNCIVGEGSKAQKGKGTTIIISGAGGKELREINLNDTEIGYFDAWNGSNIGNSYGFTKFILTKDSLQGEFIPATGSFTDSFSINI
jgi:hypothetical protein